MNSGSNFGEKVYRYADPVTKKSYIIREFKNSADIAGFKQARDSGTGVNYKKIDSNTIVMDELSEATIQGLTYFKPSY